MIELETKVVAKNPSKKKSSSKKELYDYVGQSVFPKM
jgi:hypothetical protein